MRNGFRVFFYALAACLSLAPPAGAAQAEKVYKASEVDEKAAVKRRPPVEAAPDGCANEDGVVRLRLVLHKSGEVTDVTVVRSSGCLEFDEAAQRAARKVSFTPAKKDGLAVSQSALFEYSYRIEVRRP